jgi:hypothetical protein
MDERNRGPLGWRLLAVGGFVSTAAFLGAMSFLLLASVPPASHGGLPRLALETTAAVRGHWGIFGSAFALLVVITGSGHADRLLKFFVAANLALLALFGASTAWILLG